MTTDTKELQEQLGAAQLREAALKDTIDEKDAYTESLEAQIAQQDPSVVEVKKPTIPEETATVDGKEYALVVAAFWHKGTLHVSTEAIKNTALMTELVEAESGIVKRA